MKKLLFILVFLMGQNFLFAQPYYPLPDSNVAWIRLDPGCPFPCPTPYRKFFTSIQKNDTIINSNTYIKIFCDYNLQPHISYFGAYRSNTAGKTFFVPRDSVNEFLLFDFSRNQSDTIKQLLVNYDTLGGRLADYIVDSTGSVTAGPYSLKTLSLRMIGPPPISCFYEYLTWIEKIGSLGSGVINIDRHGCAIGPELNCMQFNDTIYYDDNYWFPQSVEYLQGQCSFPVGIHNIQTTDIQITPNPFSNQITLGNLPMNEKINVQITDILGQQVFKTETSGKSSATFSFADMNNGVYFISLQTPSDILIHKKIVKQ